MSGLKKKIMKHRDMLSEKLKTYGTPSSLTIRRRRLVSMKKLAVTTMGELESLKPNNDVGTKNITSIRKLCRKIIAIKELPAVLVKPKRAAKSQTAAAKKARAAKKRADALEYEERRAAATASCTAADNERHRKREKVLNRVVADANERLREKEREHAEYVRAVEQLNDPRIKHARKVNEQLAAKRKKAAAAKRRKEKRKMAGQDVNKHRRRVRKVVAAPTAVVVQEVVPARVVVQPQQPLAPLQNKSRREMLRIALKKGLGRRGTSDRVLLNLSNNYIRMCGVGVPNKRLRTNSLTSVMQLHLPAASPAVVGKIVTKVLTEVKVIIKKTSDNIIKTFSPLPQPCIGTIRRTVNAQLMDNSKKTKKQVADIIATELRRSWDMNMSVVKLSRSVMPSLPMFGKVVKVVTFRRAGGARGHTTTTKSTDGGKKIVRKKSVVKSGVGSTTNRSTRSTRKQQDGDIETKLVSNTLKKRRGRGGVTKTKTAAKSTSIRKPPRTTNTVVGGVNVTNKTTQSSVKSSKRMSRKRGGAVVKRTRGTGGAKSKIVVRKYVNRRGNTVTTRVKSTVQRSKTRVM